MALSRYLLMSLRTDAQTNRFQDKCIILDRAVLKDEYNNFEETFTVRSVEIPCNMQLQQRVPYNNNVQNLPLTSSLFYIRLPYGTVVNKKDKIQITTGLRSGEQFEITEENDENSDSFTCVLECKKVT